MSQAGICPRCKSDTVEFGTPLIKMGKTREKRVTIRECPECRLIFYEGTSDQEGQNLA